MTHSYGNITTQSLSEIWNGENVAGLRKRLIDYDLPGNRAGFVSWVREARPTITIVGKGTSSDDEDSSATRADRFLSTPWSVEALLEALTAASSG